MARKTQEAAGPKKIKFTGVTLVNFHMSMSPKGDSSLITAHFRADFTDDVMADMEWQPRAEGWGGGTLLGELVGQEMALMPSNRELAGIYGFKMPIRSVKSFALTVKQGKKKEDEDEEVLTFELTTTSKRAYVAFGKWIENIGKAKSSLTVVYAEEQPGLIPDGVQQTEEQRQAVLGKDVN